MNTSRILTTVAILLAAAAARAEDWPTYRHDNHRSGVTKENLSLPLKQAWRYDSPSKPVTAWAGPAKWDAYAGMKAPRHMRDFDSVFHVTVAGGSVFFGSSADDAVHCLDAASGKTRWDFHTDGPVRLPPTVAGGNVYFGSDDGRAYCAKASDGSAVWKYRAAPSDRAVPSNGKLISLWPVRTGVLVAGGKAYFAASLFPWRKSQFCAVDAKTGKDSGDGLFKVTAAGHAMQGTLLASDSQLFAPQGRSAVLVFSRSDGKLVGPLGARGDGGVHALLTKDSQLIYGPGSKTGWLAMQDAKTRTRIDVFGGASRIVLGENTGYIYKPGNLSTFRLAEHVALKRQGALSRKLKALSRPPKSRRGKKETPAQAAKRKAAHAEVKRELEKVAAELKRIKQGGGAFFKFSVSCPKAYEMILAGETIFLGGDSEVHALSARDGKALWKGKVDGKARGLAVAGGRLYVSTDKGKIHCFAATNAKR
jgi:outer membrane protein assembly factor BamB